MHGKSWFQCRVSLFLLSLKSELSMVSIVFNLQMRNLKKKKMVQFCFYQFCSRKRSKGSRVTSEQNGEQGTVPPKQVRQAPVSHQKRKLQNGATPNSRRCMCSQLQEQQEELPERKTCVLLTRHGQHRTREEM